MVATLGYILLAFVIIWLMAGIISIPIVYVTRRIMHNPTPITSDVITIEVCGSRFSTNVDRGAVSYLSYILSGLVSFWLNSGALSIALYEYMHGTNYPGKTSLSYYDDAFAGYMIFGPITLLPYIPLATIHYLRSLTKK